MAERGDAFRPRANLYAAAAPEPVRILFGHYRIAYRIRPGDDVEVLGVFHGALDITRYLG